MQSPDKSDTGEAESVRRAVWLLLAVALNTLEFFLPRLPMLPWLKPGLANCITIIWIIRYGTADALLFTLIRVWISSFYFGFSLVAMSLALSGGLLSTLVMALAWHTLGRKQALGTIGIGIIGAAAHNTGQLITVYLLLTHNNAVFYQLPFMGIAALVFGGGVGAIVPSLWRILTADISVDQPKPLRSGTQIVSTPTLQSTITIAAILAGSVALVTADNLRLLGAIAVVITMMASIVLKKGPATLIYPLRMWPMFLFIALVYLFFSYGTRVPFFSLVTYEGLIDSAKQSLRLWTWLEAGLLLHRLHCNHLLFAVLKRLFPRHGETLHAGLVALEYFPDVVSFVKSKDARRSLPWKQPARATALFVERVRGFVVGLAEEG